MAYTEFGKYFKILRVKNGEVLADAKEFLNVSTAFISAVECGKKQVPADWFEKITCHYQLNDTEKKELENAIENSKNSVKIDLVAASSLQKSVALQFQRSFEDLDDEQMKEIQKILERKSKK